MVIPEAYSSRDTVVVSPPRLTDYFDEPEKVRLDLGDQSVKRHPIDIGSIAYSDRVDVNYLTSPDARASSHPVNIKSFRIERRGFLAALYDHIIISSYRSSSIYSLLSTFRLVVDWLDNNEHSDAFISIENFKNAYFDYTNHLNDQVLKSILKPRRARELQKALSDIAILNFGKETGLIASSGVIDITARREIADAPEKKLIDENVHVYLRLARGFSDSYMKKKTYPWKLDMPNYHTYVFPTCIGALKTPYTKKNVSFYNYDVGQIVDLEKYRVLNPSLKEWEIKARHENILYNLKKNNELGLNCSHRYRDVQIALVAYIQLFLLMTGAYISEVSQLEFDNSLDIERCILKNSFRVVKFRARGKEIQYNLGAKIGLEILKEYLKFRDFFLNGKECKHLFFLLSKNHEPVRCTNNSFKSALDTPSILFFKEGQPRVTSRMVRKHKSVVLHALKVGTEAISNNLNHSTSTNIKSYTPTSPEKMQSEFSNYWGAVKKAANEIKIINTTGNGEVSIPTGHCSERGEPHETSESVPIKPDCKKQYGCLFCSKYLIHADKNDIQKLFSVKFVIEQVLNISHDVNAEKLLREVIVRIDYLIERLMAFSTETNRLVNSIRVDVFDYGELTPFWLHRLHRYEDMGIIV
ncbi:hypothetical protein ACLIOE_003392 [Vibrio parahaemolyticus]|uniref:hypothetical protein n=1 Tax=Vibrio parahaemolyticus TaxID=670 RepID=UPI00301BC305